MNDSLTAKMVVELYLRHCEIEQVHCPAARADRLRTLRLFLERVGEMVIADLRSYHLTDFIESHPTWRSVSTRRAKCNEIRAAFAWAADGDRILKNPFSRVRYQEAERRPDMPETAIHEVIRLGNKPFEAAVRFLRLTGVRLSELCRATWGEFDLERGIWVISRHKSRRYTQKPKTIALVPEAVEFLLALRSVAVAAAERTGTVVVAVDDALATSRTPAWASSVWEKLRAGAAFSPTEPREFPVVAEGMPANAFVFLNTRSTPWNHVTLGQHLRRLKKRHGIKCKASLHGIRHRAASAAIRAGAPIKLVSKQLGHASVAVTERFYCDIDDAIDEMREAFGKGLR